MAFKLLTKRLGLCRLFFYITFANDLLKQNMVKKLKPHGYSVSKKDIRE